MEIGTEPTAGPRPAQRSPRASVTRKPRWQSKRNAVTPRESTVTCAQRGSRGPRKLPRAEGLQEVCPHWSPQAVFTPGHDWETVVGMSHLWREAHRPCSPLSPRRTRPHTAPGRRGQEERPGLTPAGRVPHTRSREHRLRLYLTCSWPRAFYPQREGAWERARAQAEPSALVALWFLPGTLC